MQSFLRNCPQINRTDIFRFARLNFGLRRSQNRAGWVRGFSLRMSHSPSNTIVS